MKNYIYRFTGNPFVDAGIWAICEWVGKEKPEYLDKEDLKKIMEDIVPLYLTENWSKNHYSIFPNNPITNPKVKDKEGRLSEYLDTLIAEITPIGDSGNCISCGCRDANSFRTKTEIPLIGSGSLINYFPGGQPGGDYCSACTFAVQFAPLVMYSCKRLLLLHSNSDKVMRYWARRAIQDVRRQVLEKDYSGCFNENYVNPRNALFHIIQDIILKYDERWEDEKPSISLYHFTNYIRGPDLDVYYVPTVVFRFIAYVRQHEKYPQWMQIVKRGYSRVDWSKVKEEGDYKNKANTVYSNLLDGGTITQYFIDTKSKRSLGDWDLFGFYLKEVRKMDEKRLATIKRVGDEIARYIQKTENMKRLGQFERAGNYRNFRNVLRLIVKDRVAHKEEEPLFTLDEFVEHLFPEGNLGWQETQDLLLFRIYENLHDWLVKTGQVEVEEKVPEEVDEEMEVA